MKSLEFIIIKVDAKLMRTGFKAIKKTWQHFVILPSYQTLSFYFKTIQTAFGVTISQLINRFQDSVKPKCCQKHQMSEYLCFSLKVQLPKKND